MKNRSVMMFVIMLLVFVFGVFYLSRRTAFALQCKPLYCYLIYSALLIFAISAMFVGMYVKSQNLLTHIIIVSGNVLVGVLLYLLLTMIVVDILNLFAYFSPRTFGLITFLSAFAISGYALIHAANPKINNVDIELDNLEKPLKVVHLTDIHLGHFRGEKNFEKIVQMTNAQNPDFVVITGDFFESEYNLDDKTIKPLQKINAPVFFVDGNHDIYTNDAKIKAMAAQNGARVLINEMVETNGVQIIGLDYMDADQNSTEDVVPHSVGSRTIRNTIPTFAIDRNKPTIVLHHSPIGGKFIADAGADLFLAGHTHGGQLFPLTLINNRLFEFNKGLYRKDNLQVYVSCGTGTFGPPMRLGTKSEIAVLNLKRKAR